MVTRPKLLPVLGLPFLIGLTVILNHFARGAFLQDSLMIAQVMVDGHVPQALGGESFYAHHVSPILYGFGLPGPVAFAIYMGVSMAMLAFGVYWVRPTPVGALLGVLFACSGIVIAILRFPHFEILIAASLILMLVALQKKRYRLAGLLLVVALLTREDAGFHAACFLASMIVMRRLLKMPHDDERILSAFLAAAFLGSVTSVVIQKLMFPGLFVTIYAGDHFSHVTWALVAERLAGWTLYRTYAILPMIVAIVWAFRRPYVIAGYIAVLPWLALHLLAFAELPGTLSGYYAYPLLVAMFWPLLAAPRKEATIGFSIMLAASFTIWYQQNPGQTGLLEMLGI